MIPPPIHLPFRPASSGRVLPPFLRLVALLGLASSALAATYVVDNLSDDVATAGSLPWAVAQANANANDGGDPSDTIQFDATVFASARTLTVPAGGLVFTDTSGPTIIEGTGLELLRISGGDTSRVLSVQSGVEVQILDLTLGDGLVVNDSNPTPAAEDVRGGGIYNAGTLSLTRVLLDHNRVQNPSGATENNVLAAGGAVFSSGSLTLLDCRVENNGAEGTATTFGNVEGGAIASTGELVITTSSFTGNSTSLTGGNTSPLRSLGGAIASTGSLTVTGGTVSGNSVTAASGEGGIGASSGGILAYGPTTIDSSTIADNSVTSTTTGGKAAYAIGGGIEIGGDTTLRNGTVVSGNTATASTAGLAGASSEGGGIYLSDATIVIRESTIEGNRARIEDTESGAALGGGIAVWSSLELFNCLVSGNAAEAGGGGGRLNARGGGVSVRGDGSVTFGNSSFVGNSASTLSGTDGSVSGGGLHVTGDAIVTVANCTVAGNRTSVADPAHHDAGGGLELDSGAFSLVNTVVAGNRVSASGSDPDLSGGTLTSLGHNLIGDPSGVSGLDVSDLTGSAATDVFIDQDADTLITGADLVDEGGPTRVLTLVPTSPAIHAGDDSLIPQDPGTTATATTDQRGTGFPRIVGPHVDIGAYESYAYTIDSLATAFGGDNVLDAAELAAGQTISGTTTAPDGFEVQVDIGGIGATATATGGTWSLVVDDGTSGGSGAIDISGLPDGTTVVSVGGGAADTFSLAVYTYTIDSLAAAFGGDGVINAAELAAGQTISGTTSAPDGHPVRVTIGSVVATTTADSGLWSLIVDDGTSGVSGAIDMDGLNDGTITVDVGAGVTGSFGLDRVAAFDDFRVNVSPFDDIGFSGSMVGIEFTQVVSFALTDRLGTVLESGTADVFGGNVSGPITVPAETGAYTVTVSATDEAGNPATASVTFVVFGSGAEPLVLAPLGTLGDYAPFTVTGTTGVLPLAVDVTLTDAEGQTLLARVASQTGVGAPEGGGLWSAASGDFLPTAMQIEVESDGTYDKDPALAVLNDGSSVVVWRSDEVSGRLFYRRYSDTLTPLAAEVEFPAGGSIFRPSVAALADGGWVVTCSVGSSVVQQRFADDDTPVGGFTTFDKADGPRVAGLTGGGWVVAFRDGSTAEVSFQLFDAGGDPVGGRQGLGVSQTSLTSVAALPGGGFVVSAIAFGNAGDGGDWDIVCRAYDNTGSPITGVLLADDPDSTDDVQASVAALTDGGWIVAWRAALPDFPFSAVQFQRFSAAGVKEGAVQTASDVGSGDLLAWPAVAGLPDGGWTLLWQKQSPLELVADIVYRTYDSAGSPRFAMPARFAADIGDAATINQTPNPPRIHPDGSLLYPFAVDVGVGPDGGDIRLASMPVYTSGNPLSLLAEGIISVLASVTDDAGTSATDSLVTILNNAIPEVHVFYNHSGWDGNDAAADAADDGAIAPDKAALLPGGVATLANYTSYSRGLNGLMVDIVNLPGTPTAEDFLFRTGNDHDPSGWSTAPDPSSFTVRTGEGVDGSDRITLIWADNNLDGVTDANEAVAGAWLELTVKATANTGLAADQVFYFGNAPGEAGNSGTDAVVDTSDVLRPFNNQTGAGGAALDSLVDFNRDQVVDTTDVLLPFNHQTGLGTALVLLNLGGSVATSSQPVVQAMNAARLSALLRGAPWSGDPAPVVAPVVFRPSEEPGWMILEAPADGHSWRLESSEGLTGWTAEDRVPESDGTVWRWWIPIPDGPGCRFYRVVATAAAL